ncbi:hypothetical protein M1M34_gp077 [Haloarcula tailed virus 2]|uniref:Uncharacterized protein n=1 Tax=Haloarcula tailed virus 2 TaxID=2877989 RepID=A0AAE8Y0N5_9CAUD|nr:hypothetical protein M1M34_gp077 [Haloarcula tailed virus 2]UBF23256.1 hypothetical protein HATV-2_gp105 [Haloarcula tailed virus 2]
MARSRGHDEDRYSYELDKVMASVMPRDWEGHDRIEEYEAEN